MSKQQPEPQIPDQDYDDFEDQMQGQSDPPKQPKVPVDKQQQA